MRDQPLANLNPEASASCLGAGHDGSPLIGPRPVEPFDDSLGALTVELSNVELSRMDFPL